MPKKNKFPINITHKFRSSRENNQDNSDDDNVPEHFKYGVYYADGYDYMKHLVSMEDFRNPEFELPNLSAANDADENPTIIQPDQKMDENVEEIDEIFEDNDEIVGEEGEDFFGNLIEVEKKIEDEESSDEETCKGAAAIPEKNVTFGKSFVESLAEIADDLFEELEENDEFSDNIHDKDECPSIFPDYFKQRLAEISETDSKVGPLTEEDKKNILKFADLYETEYDADDLDREIDKWWKNRKVKFDIDIFNPPTKKPNLKNQPKKLKLDFSGIDKQIEKQKLQSGSGQGRKQIESESMTVSTEESIDDGSRKQPAFVHRQRGKMETTEEKKERKREIKEARRNRRTEKKQNQKLHSCV